MEPIKYLWAIRGILNRPFFAKFGSMSYIGKPVIIIGKKKISIADKVRILPGIRLEAYGGGTIQVRDNCSIAQNVHITSKDDDLVIGSGTTVLANSFITNIDHDYTEIDKPIFEQDTRIEHTEIGENCFIGMGAAIMAGTVLGKQCVVGANAVVKGTYPDYSVIAGVPAKIIKRYNAQSGLWEKV
ncbi:MAG: DapH/DapD/GlmU-related protein [Lachnospiraceae bacterium]|nr:DapH/DapD/GlmU-related protein [Lachnospiraceae bacterium]